MKRIQIGALYMFSYVSKDFLEILKHFEEMLDSEDEDEMGGENVRIVSGCYD